MKTKLYTALARCGEAYLNCMSKTPQNREWADKHMERLKHLAAVYLPSGAGFDEGCRVTMAGEDHIDIRTSFHHMNEGGMYDGWTEHTLTIRPSFTGLKIKISGENRNDIKDYIHEVFDTALNAEVEEYPQ